MRRAACLALLLAGGMAMAEADVRASCIAEGKAAVPPGLCAHFAARLAVLSPGAGEARLVVLAAGEARFVARIDWRSGGDWLAGRALGMAQADAPFEPGRIAEFLDELIAATPRP